MINILSVLIYAWCLYTIFYDSSPYADYMGTPSEPESDDSAEEEAEDPGEDDELKAEESEESSDEAD